MFITQTRDHVPAFFPFLKRRELIAFAPIVMRDTLIQHNGFSGQAIHEENGARGTRPSIVPELLRRLSMNVSEMGNRKSVGKGGLIIQSVWRKRLIGACCHGCLCIVYWNSRRMWALTRESNPGKPERIIRIDDWVGIFAFTCPQTNQRMSLNVDRLDSHTRRITTGGLVLGEQSENDGAVVLCKWACDCVTIQRFDPLVSLARGLGRTRRLEIQGHR